MEYTPAVEYGKKMEIEAVVINPVGVPPQEPTQGPGRPYAPLVKPPIVGCGRRDARFRLRQLILDH
jgi:hypothetical protein